MSKYMLIGGVNLLLAVCFISFLYSAAFERHAFSSSVAFLEYLVPNIVLFFSASINLLVGYKLLIKKDRKTPATVYVVVITLTILWFIMLFVGSFTAATVWFPIISLMLAAVVFFVLRKFSNRFAMLLASLTLLVAGCAIAGTFEEAHCWKKGEEADVSGSDMVAATKEDVEMLREFIELQEGRLVSASFREHMRCHQTFSFSEALQERYLFK